MLLGARPQVARRDGTPSREKLPLGTPLDDFALKLTDAGVNAGRLEASRSFEGETLDLARRCGGSGQDRRGDLHEAVTGHGVAV